MTNTKYFREWRKRNPDKIKGYLKKWKEGNPKRVIELRSKYKTSKKGKNAEKKYSEKYPERIKARRITNNAIKKGYLNNPTLLKCILCVNKAVEYHHSDYNKPLEVIPLCKKCHTQINNGGI